MENMNEKNIILAYFDILGTSKLLNDGKYQKVYEFYTEMIKLCSDNRTPIAIHNPLFNKRKLFPDINNVIADLADFDMPFHIVDYDLHNAFFSDTFLLWIEIDSFLQPTLSGFLEKCCIVFCQALKRAIPLRGVISIGSAIMDESNHIYLGKPLAEAAKAEPQQNWVGIGLGCSIQNINQMDTKYLLPYFNHIKPIKNEKERLLGGWVLDWPSWWRNENKDEVGTFITNMNSDEKFSSYYDNCLSFVEVSKQREIIWKLYDLFKDVHTVIYLCSLNENLNTNQRQLKKQGIELLLSYDVNEFINSVLKMNTSLWLDQRSRDVLISLKDGIIEVDGKEYVLRSDKEISFNNL